MRAQLLPALPPAPPVSPRRSTRPPATSAFAASPDLHGQPPAERRTSLAGVARRRARSDPFPVLLRIVLSKGVRSTATSPNQAIGDSNARPARRAWSSPRARGGCRSLDGALHTQRLSEGRGGCRRRSGRSRRTGPRRCARQQHTSTPQGRRPHHHRPRNTESGADRRGIGGHDVHQHHRHGAVLQEHSQRRPGLPDGGAPRGDVSLPARGKRHEEARRVHEVLLPGRDVQRRADDPQHPGDARGRVHRCLPGRRAPLQHSGPQGHGGSDHGHRVRPPHARARRRARRG